MIWRVILLALAAGAIRLAVLFAHASDAVRFLILLALGTAWVLSLVVHAFGRCPLCFGKGNLRRNGKRRAPKCPLCHGLKRRQRFCSRTVHRIRRQVAAHWRGPR